MLECGRDGLYPVAIATRPLSFDSRSLATHHRLRPISIDTPISIPRFRSSLELPFQPGNVGILHCGSLMIDIDGYESIHYLARADKRFPTGCSLRSIL